MKLISLIAAVLLISGMAMASPSFLGTSGSIFTPDDTILPASGFSANYNGISLDSQTPSIIGASVGVNGGLEIGLARVDADVHSGDISTILNAKFLAMSETASRPSLVVGAVDMTGAISGNGDGSFYALVGKSLTSVATGLTGRPSIPLHGYLGFGSGMYDGMFAGLSWQLSPQLKLMGEYINNLDIKNALNTSSVFNVGAAFTFSDAITGDLALVNGNDLGFGLAYTKAIQ